MAEPQGFSEANVTLGPPPGYEGAVVPLPVLRLIGGQLISCWRLNERELVEVARTRKIYLAVWGGLSQPPVAIAAFLDQLREP